MKSKLRACLFFAIIFTLPLGTSAQNLTELPFGIVIGQTKNSEIENRGVCEKEIKVKERYFRCEVYSMAGGKFMVLSSHNEVVTAVVFPEYGKGIVLPKKWRELGLKLRNKRTKEQGTSTKDFLRIIKEQGAENIVIKYDKNSTLTPRNHIRFELGNYLFEAKIRQRKTYPDGGDNSPYGLCEIRVTELY